MKNILLGLLSVAIAYLIGCINGAYILTKILHNKDIRQYGSGNPGSTNTLRTFGPKTACCVFLFDVIKAYAAVKLSGIICPGNSVVNLLASIAVVVGHDWSIMLGFKGGKGVASSLGVGFAHTPLLALSCFLISLIIILLTRLVSLANLIAVFAVIPLCLIFSKGIYAVILYIVLFALCALRHRENIQRLLNGTESRLDLKLKKK
ncbi:MAG: glycerol-3-phosphate 1-O-acyltransferase PlsY [Eubacteriaceae bacterium]|nr:glycerol-3-phosphate 1-O-acyltransferase PlsY [Eubacteriaceae bacterium]